MQHMLWKGQGLVPDIVDKWCVSNLVIIILNGLAICRWPGSGRLTSSAAADFWLALESHRESNSQRWSVGLRRTSGVLRSEDGSVRRCMWAGKTESLAVVEEPGLEHVGVPKRRQVDWGGHEMRSSTSRVKIGKSTRKWSVGRSCGSSKDNLAEIRVWGKVKYSTDWWESLLIGTPSPPPTGPLTCFCSFRHNLVILCTWEVGFL